MFYISPFCNSLFPISVLFLTSTIHALPDYPDIVRCDPKYGTGLSLTACSFAVANMPHGNSPDTEFNAAPPDILAFDPNQQSCPVEYLDHDGEPLFLSSSLLVHHCYYLHSAIYSSPVVHSLTNATIARC